MIVLLNTCGAELKIFHSKLRRRYWLFHLALSTYFAQTNAEFVIPAKAGIQCGFATEISNRLRFRTELDPGLRRGDEVA
jgi:hypothetical protein